MSDVQSCEELVEKVMAKLSEIDEKVDKVSKVVSDLDFNYEFDRVETYGCEKRRLSIPGLRSMWGSEKSA